MPNTEQQKLVSNSKNSSEKKCVMKSIEDFAQKWGVSFLKNSQRRTCNALKNQKWAKLFQPRQGSSNQNSNDSDSVVNENDKKKVEQSSASDSFSSSTVNLNFFFTRSVNEELQTSWTADPSLTPENNIASSGSVKEGNLSTERECPCNIM